MASDADRLSGTSFASAIKNESARQSEEGILSAIHKRFVRLGIPIYPVWLASSELLQTSFCQSRDIALQAPL